jgi:phosphatidylserine/phosphatidylglycerophosphate/cardiolipin synthase-like enzyme
MSEQLLTLSSDDLNALAAALRCGRLTAPFTSIALSRIVPGEASAAVAAELQKWNEAGVEAAALATILELLVRDRVLRPGVDDVFDLVTTGPEAAGVTNRDTAVVVRELFANAQESVLVAGYAVYQGKRVFEALAERLAERPDLKVRMFLDIQRGPGDTTAAPELVRWFIARFRTRDWPPDRRLPELFYDPRSLDPSPDKRASLHAKTIVVDARDVFVSSANFTEAAQERNLEIGLLVHSRSLAERIIQYFEKLVGKSLLQPMN